MTETKDSRNMEEPTPPTGSAENGTAEDTQADELEILRRDLKEAQDRAEENLDGWQRALADFQNYKKRVERDRIADQEAMKGDLIRRVLPVLDDLERALSNRREGDPWASGIELIQRKLQSILEGEGLRRIEAEGAIFDPSVHEAISQEPSDSIESGRVIAVTLNGYTLGERVIRPAQVRVAA